MDDDDRIVFNAGPIPTRVPTVTLSPRTDPERFMAKVMEIMQDNQWSE